MSETPLVTPMDPKTLEPEIRKTSNRLPLIYIIIILVGIAFGWVLFRQFTPASDSVVQGTDIIQTKDEVGSTDTATFRDTAAGTIEAGGSNGEGTHKLIREGGTSQTVYLVSSIVDLDQYVGQKVEVWGETIRAQKVGWLMDVGRLKLVQ